MEPMSNIEINNKSLNILKNSNPFLLNINSEKSIKICPINKSFDIFKEKCIYDYLILNYSSEVETETNSSEDINFNDIEYKIYTDRICRLCLKKSPNNIFIPLFNNNYELISIGKELISILGENILMYDLLPQQICISCEQKIKVIIENKKLFQKSYNILNKTLKSFKDETLILPKNNQKNVKLLVKIGNNYYDLSTDGEQKQSIMDTGSCKQPKLVSPKLKKISSRFCCGLCSKKFSTLSKLNRHSSSSHSCQVKYKCVFCDASLSSLAELSKHLNTVANCRNLYRKRLGQNENVLSRDTIQHTTEAIIPLENSVADTRISETYVDAYKEDLVIKLGISDVEDSLSGDDEDNIYSIDDNSILVETRRNHVHDESNPRFIVKEQVDVIISHGQSMFRQCVHCGLLFKRDRTDLDIQKHILFHLCSSKEKTNDVENFDLTEHINFVPCFMCQHCGIPKLNKEKIKQHLVSCKLFRKEHNLKIKDRRKKHEEKLMTKCSYCEDVFSNRKVFRSHVELVHPETMKTCHVCGKSFISKLNLRSHISVAHIGKAKVGPILCEFCPKVCRSQSGYSFHIKYGHSQRKPLAMKKNREYYRKKNYNLEDCDICGRQIPTRPGDSRLEFHKLKHTFPEGNVECCNRSFTTYISFIRHERSHQKQWKCRLCVNTESIFVSYAALLDHLDTGHDKNDFSCPVCGKVLQNRSKQLSHMNVHIKANKATYCEKCGVEFSNRKEYLYHKKQENCEMPFVESNGISCQDRESYKPVYCCGTKFTKLNNLKIHMAKHQDTICKKCGEVLKSKLALISHNFTHHRSKDSDCPICHKQLANIDSLKFHMIKHTRGKQFSCICGLSFYTQNELNRHYKRRKTPCIEKILTMDNTNFIIEEVPDHTVSMIGSLMQDQSLDEHSAILLSSGVENETLFDHSTIVLGSAILQKFE